MKIYKFLNYGALIIGLSILGFVACKKNSTATSTTNTLTNADDNGGYASDAAVLESTGNSVTAMADNVATQGGAGLRTTSCVTITQDSVFNGAVWTHNIHINFTPGCTCFDGKVRSGTINVQYTGRYKDSGSSHIITSTDYHVGSYKVIVNKTVQNMGMNTSGQVWYNVTVGDSVYLTADSVISWTGNRTRTWLTGYSTPTLLDDSYKIGGTTSVTRANGHIFTHAIEPSAPLVVATTCPWIEAGKVDITGTTISGTRILDYGDTINCDDIATLTIGTHTYTIYMR